MGSDALHYADDPVTVEAEVFRARCEAVLTPVVTLCGAALRGDVVVMNPEYGHREDKPDHRPVPVCRRCKMFAARLPECELSWPRYTGRVDA
jgi:hypothetical protein